MPEGVGEVCRVGVAIAVVVGVTVASVVLGVLGQATLAIELYHMEVPLCCHQLTKCCSDEWS